MHLAEIMSECIHVQVAADKGDVRTLVLDIAARQGMVLRADRQARGPWRAKLHPPRSNRSRISTDLAHHPYPNLDICVLSLLK